MRRTAASTIVQRLKSTPAEKGDILQISFETRNEFAQIMDRGTDVRIRLGDSAVMDKLNQNLMGCLPGSRIRFSVKPSVDRPDLVWDPKKIVRMDRRKLNVEEQGIQTNARVLVFDGQKDVPATVIEQNSFEVVLDFNHPESKKVGKLEYDVRVMFNYGNISNWDMRKDRIQKFKQNLKPKPQQIEIPIEDDLD
jgi:FKBP-type peptidyl-prolyl cis-trans isomerase 2